MYFAAEQLEAETVNEPSTDQFLNAALDYLGRGWSINPLAPKGKTPVLTEANYKATWKNYQNMLPSQAEVKYWFRNWPNANLMIITGITSGLVVLDIDGPEGQTTLAEYEKTFGTLPRTMLAKTGKGLHYYFQHPGFEVRNFAQKAPGIDFRGDGGYVVAPPSIHPSGAQYEWINGPETPLAPLPEWLLELIQGGKQQKLTYEAKVNPVEILAGVQEGRRNDALFKYASRLRAQGIRQVEAEILVKQAGTNCTPPLPEEEVESIINSVWTRYPAGEQKLPRLVEDISNSDDWRLKLERDKKGFLTENPLNVMLILKNDVNLKGKIMLNQFSNKVEILGELPWFRNDGFWNDANRSALCNYLFTNYGYRWVNRIDMAFEEFVNKNAYHPVREYLQSLVWDGMPRVEHLLIDFMECEDSNYVRTITRMTFTACVARVFEPGIKFDTILTLVGEQGGGKSTLLSKLSKGWFSDSISDIGNKDALQLLQGNLIIELGELSAVKKTDLEHLKQFITRQIDEFRPPYGRITQRFPRQCVFFGTTNKVGFLSDPTGGRRFLPVRCGAKATTAEKVSKLTPDYIDQFWAEAYSLYKRGEKLYLDFATSEEAEVIRHGFEQEEPSAGMIERYLNLLLPSNWEDLSIGERRFFVEHEATSRNEKGHLLRKQVCVAEIAVECLGFEPGQIPRAKSCEITDILNKLKGWEKSPQGVRIKGYGRQRVFVRIGTDFC